MPLDDIYYDCSCYCLPVEGSIENKIHHDTYSQMFLCDTSGLVNLMSIHQSAPLKTLQTHICHIKVGPLVAWLFKMDSKTRLYWMFVSECLFKGIVHPETQEVNDLGQGYSSKVPRGSVSIIPSQRRSGQYFFGTVTHFHLGNCSTL